MAKATKSKKITPPGSEDFNIQLVEGFQGYVSSIDPTIADPRVMVRGSYNTYPTIRGTIANRPGRLLWDNAKDATVATVTSGYVWNTSLGAVIPLRASNAKLQFSSDIKGTQAWYDLLTNLTKERFVFDHYWDNTDKKDKLLMVNGTKQTVYNWAGGIALFVSATSTVITLDRDAATAGFASSGTVTINGNDYTYTGISGKTLTGAQNASAETANSVVFSKIITTTSFTSGPASTYPCDFIKVVENQLYLGSYTSQLVYMSKNTDYTNFGSSSPRLTGEGDNLLMDASPTGIGQVDGNAAIFYGPSHLAEITFSQITVGSTLSEQTKIGKVFLGNNCAALAHEFIDQLWGNILYLDQANQLRTYGLFTNLFAAKPVMLSQAVQTELAEEDFTNGSLKVESDRSGELVYINAPKSGKSYLYRQRSTPDSLGRVVQETKWYPPFTWNITRVDAISGTIVGFSNENPQIYQLWDTGQWHDDSPNGNVPYQSIALFSYQNLGVRNYKLNFDKIYWEGYMTPGSYVYGGVYYDYQGAVSILSPIINDDTSLLTDGSGGTKRQLFTGQQPPSLGDASLGDIPLGDGLNIAPDDQATVPKFRCITEVSQIDCFEYALMAYSESLDARWEILALGTNEDLSFALPVEIIKI